MEYPAHSTQHVAPSTEHSACSQDGRLELRASQQSAESLRGSPNFLHSLSPNKKWRRKNKKKDVGLLSGADGAWGTDARDEGGAPQLLVAVPSSPELPGCRVGPAAAAAGG